MSRAVVAAALVAVVVSVFASVAQMDSCNSELPVVLVSNYSGLACQPVWSNFVLRYHQDKNNVLRIVLSTVYSTGWVSMGFSRDGLIMGSPPVLRPPSHPLHSGGSSLRPPALPFGSSGSHAPSLLLR